MRCVAALLLAGLAGQAAAFRSCSLTGTVAGSFLMQPEDAHCTAIYIHADLSPASPTDTIMKTLAASLGLGSEDDTLDLARIPSQMDAIMTSLTATLGPGSEVDTLDLAGTRIGDDGAVRLAELLKANHVVKRLDLSACGIGDSGVAALADALSVNTALCDVDLSANAFGANGTVALAAALPHNTRLRVLWLFDNAVGAKGALALAAAIPKAQSLSRLGLGGIVHGSDGSKSYVHVGDLARGELAEAEAQVRSNKRPSRGRGRCLLRIQCPRTKTSLLKQTS